MQTNTQASKVDAPSSPKDLTHQSDTTADPEKRVLDSIAQNELDSSVNSDSSETVPARTKLENILLISALCLANFLVALDTTITTTALPAISAQLNSTVGYAWIGSAYILATAVTTPIWAKLSDIWGRKPLLLLSIAIFFAGSLFCGISTKMLWLILARALQGIGGGGIGTLVTICISDTFSMRERPIYFGIIGMSWAFASACGPLLGGILTTKASWKWCFFINLPCGALSFIVVFFKLHVYTPKTPFWEGIQGIDWLGSLVLIPATILFLLGLQMGGIEHPWESPMILCFLIFGVVLGGLFVLVEAKFAKYPLIPLRLFKNLATVSAMGVGCFHSMTLTGVSYFLPLYFQGVLGASPLMSGVYLLPLTLSLSLTSLSTGFVVKATGKYLLIMRISAFFMVLGSGLFIDLPHDRTWSKIIIYQIIAGLGVGPNFQCPMIALQAATPQGDHAIASSTNNFFRNLSASVVIVVSTAIFQNGIQNQQPQLVEVIGLEKASLLTGFNAAANVEMINELPEPMRGLTQKLFLKSMLGMWIMYLLVGALAFACSLFVKDLLLTKEHKVTETGLQAEESKRVAEIEKRVEKTEGSNC